jgi:hypothetical protein
LARTIIQGYKDRENVSLPVHDAEVKGIGEYKNTEEYNRKFYLTNRDYSIMQEFADAMTRLANEPNATKITLWMSVGGVNQHVTFEQMARILANTNEVIQKRRDDIFSQDMKIGQMIGENGSMMDTRDSEDTKPIRIRKSQNAKGKTSTTARTKAKTPKGKKAETADATQEGMANTNPQIKQMPVGTANVQQIIKNVDKCAD